MTTNNILLFLKHRLKVVLAFVLYMIVAPQL